MKSDQNLAEISSVTLLSALNAVALDTETTGLDVRSDRLVQIGAVRIMNGTILRDETFDCLVKPDIPIPSNVVAIHGITDADVAAAPTYLEVKNELENWIGNAIVIGFSIGFDLAILKRENLLAKQEWHSPRSIDVSHVIKILSPQLPDYSLDTIASWLGVNTDLRHQAVGDAIITAEVFQLLVPKLLDKGIRTLSELEAEIKETHNDAATESKAGWYDFLSSNKPKDIYQQALARIDSYPYRHRVYDIMSAPPVVVNSNTSLANLLSIMIEQKISCAFVEKAEPPFQYGIITERDLLRTINKSSEPVLNQSVGKHAQFPLQVVSDEAFIYRAIGRMARSGFKHLGVVDKHNILCGALTPKDLLKQRSDDALDLGDAIDKASTEELSLVWAKLVLVAGSLDKEDVDARNIASVISRELRALTRRACQIAEKELGSPPVPYAMLVLGSAGRDESLLAMDQDNAIIFESGEAGGEIDFWFERLGTKVADILNYAGVPYCEGGIMAKNLEWRMSVSNWKKTIQTWITRTSPDDILKTDIFFDAVTVHGSSKLTDEVVDFAFKTGCSSKNFLNLMANNVPEPSSSFGLFGKFRTKNGRIDIKYNGILPIVSAARVEAIRHQIEFRSTPQRLAAVQKKSGKQKLFFENLTEAHRIILSLILKQQLYDVSNGIKLTNKVDPEKMPQIAKNNLKWALQQITSISDLLGKPV